MLSRHLPAQQKWTEERRYFESEGRPLYGAMYRAERPGAPIVLFCNSFSENHCEGRADRARGAAGPATAGLSGSGEAARSLVGSSGRELP